MSMRLSRCVCSAFLGVSVSLFMPGLAQAGEGVKAMLDDTSRFMPVPEINTVVELREWLRRQEKPGLFGKRRRIRLPVEVKFSDKRGLKLESARALVGASSDAHRLELRLDNTGTSRIMEEWIRSQCGADEVACTLWLEGYAGQLMAMTTSPGNSGDRQETWFTVLRVLDRIPDKDRHGAGVRVLVEGR